MLKSLSYALLTGASLALLLGCDVDVNAPGEPADIDVEDTTPDMPDVETPDVDAPDVDAPDVDAPDVDVEAPGVDVEANTPNKKPVDIDVDGNRD